MTVPEFFELFLEEMKGNNRFWSYYKFLRDPRKLGFRKAYFCQRLQYVSDNIGPKDQAIWDCGCGYGTTAIFLAMNGYKVYGTTLEHYFSELGSRKKFWSRHGDIGLFECDYGNLFDSNFQHQFDTIILQDVLHHLEPVNKAVGIIRNAVKKNGKLLVLEENGSNPVQNIKLFRQRGFRRITSYHDDKLNKRITLGNEYIRSLKKWESIFRDNEFSLDKDSVQYIRLFPPFLFKNYQAAIKKESALANRYPTLRKFYFGINFICYPADHL